MIITHKTMREINAVQTEILRDVSNVCRQLNIPFYMVHGSLLGTIRDHKFVPGDDDIDIALFRKDYERFLEQAPTLLKDCYFVQSHVSEENYPLEFAKVRDSRTTYIIEIASHLKMNHGIYIDVFPIDNFPVLNAFQKTLYAIKHKLLKIRIKSVWNIPNEPFIKKAAGVVAKLYCPSVKKAICKLDILLKSAPEGELVRISGGKPREQGIPKAWFDNLKEDIFEGVPVYIPGDYDKYLTAIYGDYSTRTLLENKQADAQGVEINASVVDINRAYTEYCK